MDTYSQCQQKQATHQAQQSVTDSRIANGQYQMRQRVGESLGRIPYAEQILQLGSDYDQRRGRRKSTGHRRWNEVNDETQTQDAHQQFNAASQKG